MHGDKTVNRWSVLFVTTLASFLNPFMGSSINIALPVIGDEFNMDAVLLSWVPSAFILASVVFLIPLGRLADIYGRKRLFTWGVAGYTIASLISALAGSPAMLIAARVLQGIGAAMLFGTAMAILTSVFPPHERGRALGINVSAVYTGLSAGPFIGGLLTEHFGWRSIFYINSIMGVAILAMVIARIRHEWRGAEGERFDLGGAVLYGLTIIALMAGFSLLPGTAGIVLIAAGISGTALFIRRELDVEHPVLDIRLIRQNTVFAYSNLATLIHYSATMAVSFLLSLYLQNVRGFSPRDAGMILVIQPVLMALFSPLTGRLSDTVEPRRLASSGMGCTAAGLVALVFLREDTGLTLIVTTLVLMGLGFALFSSPNTNAVMSSVEKKNYGIASAILGTMRLTGNMLSMGITMMVFSLVLGRVRLTPEQAGPFMMCMRILFTVYAVMCVIGVFASLARGNIRSGD